DYVPVRGYNTLTARLLDHKEFRDQYRLMLEEILDTSFTIGALEPKVTNMYNQLRTYITLDPHKSRKSINLFEKEPELILQFISNRNRYLLEQLKNLT
ncbi:MAG TPA: CotH kinase family protein, partial [Bacillus sp. (in: firmicutes)]